MTEGVIQTPARSMACCRSDSLGSRSMPVVESRLCSKIRCTSDSCAPFCRPGRSGGCPTAPPTDPCVRHSRTRFLGILSAFIAYLRLG